MNIHLAHVQIDTRNGRAMGEEIPLLAPISKDDIYKRLLKEAGEEAVKARETWSHVLAAEPFLHKK